MEYKEAYSYESWGEHSFGIKILVSMDRELNEKDNSMLYRQVEVIKEAMMKETYLLDPKKQEVTKDITEKIKDLFPQNIYMEAIPNQYCSQYCCVHIPWFNVTTPVGVIKIGWRKRVLAIDWSNSQVKKRAEDLFPNEDTTKLEYGIHAWGYDKAKEYISKLMEANNGA